MLATWAGLSWWLSWAKLATDYLLMVMTIGGDCLAQETPCSGNACWAPCAGDVRFMMVATIAFTKNFAH